MSGQEVPMEQGPAFLFRTTEFTFTRDAGERTRSGIFGKGLAAWLAERLPRQGLKTRGVIDGELGWYVVLETRPQMYVACARDPNDHTKWRAFPVIERSWVDRAIGRGEGLRDAGKVYKAVKAVLEAEPDIEELQLEGHPEAPVARRPA
jgi:hypothetical protein